MFVRMFSTGLGRLIGGLDIGRCTYQHVFYHGLWTCDFNIIFSKISYLDVISLEITSREKQRLR